MKERKEEVKSMLVPYNYDDLSVKEQEVIDAKVSDAFTTMNYEVDLSKEQGRLRTLSYNCIYGTYPFPK